MQAEIRKTDLEIVERYTDQPAAMPLPLRERIEA